MNLATRFDKVRFLNTVLGIWLFISAFVLTTQSAGTRWNNGLVAIAIFLISLAPPERLQLAPHGPTATHAA